ncbi:hypothetical protein G4B88_020631 [Cannabis sativa]|uniref:Reverse transcriptase zinc-binding domain-containing protein n=1 Tax=Cannabis sativa TaxID=3483 RepID=A0A7J6DN45_CANSA|nr:hypothetical protein G4B88_020631 [Cannabis sativa]
MDPSQIGPDMLAADLSMENDILVAQDIPLDDAADPTTKVLVGKVFLPGSLPLQRLRDRLVTLGHIRNGLTIDFFMEDLFLLTFGSATEKVRILEGQPWHFLQRHIVLAELPPFEQIISANVRLVPFWVQIHRLPIRRNTEAMGVMLGNYMGTFDKYDDSTRFRFLRIRVLLDAYKPLLRGKRIQFEDSQNSLWVDFKYERLAEFCEFCGRITHKTDECPAVLNLQEQGLPVERTYFPLIRTAGLPPIALPRPPLARPYQQNPMIIPSLPVVLPGNNEVPAIVSGVVGSAPSTIIQPTLKSDKGKGKLVIASESSTITKSLDVSLTQQGSNTGNTTQLILPLSLSPTKHSQERTKYLGMDKGKAKLVDETSPTNTIGTTPDIINAKRLKANEDTFLLVLQWLAEDNLILSFSISEIHRNDNTIEERLDWALVNEDWNANFPEARLTHLDFFGSDHRVLSLEFGLSPVPSSNSCKKRKRFRYEALWKDDPECQHIIANSWLPTSEFSALDTAITNIASCSTIGRSPSYIWKSIIWGRELLIKGLRKRVGTGDTILVFQDPWLPRPFSFKPTSFNHSHSNLLVKDLMAETRIGWNVDLLRVLFNEADQQCIGSIPLCKFPKEDSWMWHYTVDGSYSVKSGYYVASQLNLTATSPSKDEFSIWWKKFWKLHLPNKVLNCNWRGFHEILPTSKGLQKRSILPHSNCLICGFSNESNGHAVFWCRVAAWYVWSERTQIVHGREQFSPTVVVSRIHKLHAEFSAKLISSALGAE